MSDPQGKSPRLAPVAGLTALARASRGLEDESSLAGISAAFATAPGSGIEALRLAAHEVGLPARTVEGSFHSAASFVATGETLLLVLDAEEEPARIVLLHGQAAGRLELVEFAEDGSEQRSEVLVEELAERLSISNDSQVRWLVVDHQRPGRPSAATSPAGQEMTPLRRLIGILLPDRSDVLAVVAFAVATGILSLATPIAVQSVVNSVALGGALQPLLVIGLLLFLGLGIAGILTAYQTFVVEILQRRIFARLVADFTNRLPRVPVDVFDQKYGPELVNRFFDVITIHKAGAPLLLNGLALVLSVLVGLIILAFYHPLLLAFDILLLLAIAFIVFASLKRGTKTAIEESEAKYAMAAWLQELARHPSLFRTDGVQTWIQRRSDHLARTFLERRSAHFGVLFRQVMYALALQALASTALLGLGGWLVIQGTLSLGQLVAAELIVTTVVGSVAKVGKHLENYYDLMAATDKVGKLLDLPMESQGGEAVVQSTAKGGVELELIDLGTDRRGTTARFDGLSVKVPAGGSLGIAGPSGAGKNALLSHIFGLREPDHGTIRLDGRSIRELSLGALRRAVTLVDTVEIIEGTIRENVRLGRPFVTDDDVRDALRRVRLLDEFEQLPEGLDSKININGWPLSGSELRCLQIARAIAGRPRLLLVSDLFLPLSEERRELLVELMCHKDSGWTLVIVSNDDHVLDHCDQILELPSGTVRTPADAVAQASDPSES